MEIDFKELGQRIKQRRREIGFTQKLLAELVGISPQYLGEIENSRKQVSLTVLVNLSERLELSIDELLYGEERVSGNRYLNDFAVLLSDCSPSEGQVLYEAGKALKKVLMSHRY
ncbi:MAG: helix-turn-helix domain-containing protein [Lachnospiraceae bacterium]|nr:helix-turn-helix domain-containing protein [Lachnospiraceae bacterium]